MKHTITLFLADGGWMATDTDPQVRKLFGTDTLPTPFLVGTHPEMVQDAVQRLNPGAVVVLRGVTP